MTTNARNCKVIDIEIATYNSNIELVLSLCPTDCDGEDPPVVKFPLPVFDQASSGVQVSVVGYNKLHIIASDGRANCVSVSITRLIKCQNCSEGCDPLVIEEDMGCISTGHILATGDYVIYVTPQINWAATEIDNLTLKIVLEPIIEEHINVALINNRK